MFLSEEAPTGQFLLKAMDHTHCFTCGKELSRTIRDLDRIRDPRVFGLFPEFRRFLDRSQVKQAAIDLRRFDRAKAARMTEGIPKEWEVSSDALDALRDLIVGRAAFVADTIESQIWPQGEFDFDKQGETGQ